MTDIPTRPAEVPQEEWDELSPDQQRIIWMCRDDQEWRVMPADIPLDKIRAWRKKEWFPA